MTEINPEMKALLTRHTEAIEQKFGKLGLDEIKVKLAEADIRILELEQKGARPHGSPAPETLGDQFASHANELAEIAQASANGRRATFGLELKTTITTGATSGGPVAGQAYRDGIVMLPQRRLRVRDLLPVVPISTGSYEYAQQTVRTNNANTVAEGSLKPESAYGFVMRTGVPRVIAHWVPASRQILEDAPQLAGLINSELLYGLALKEDAQILAGDGTGENLGGLIPAAQPYVAPFTPASSAQSPITMIEQIGLAILQATLSDFEPTGIVMHPSDWMRIKLLKDAAGGYLVLDPTTGLVGLPGQPQPQLFGVPIATTTSMTVDKFLVGDFQRAATIYDRWAPRVEVSTEHADFFVRNQVAILAEERIGLAIKQAGALIYGDFGNVA